MRIGEVMSVDKTALAARIKEYESLTVNDKLISGLPVIVRLDGVAFHTFTKGFKRPYDEFLSQLMINTTKYLVKETNARCGYTQSDEITLVLYSDNYNSQIYFDGRIQKILSVLAARCSVFFNTRLKEHSEKYYLDKDDIKQLRPGFDFLEKKAAESPVFDCRIFVVPNKDEAVNTLIWREKDATRNSISMAAQSVYSHGELDGKSASEKQEMLFASSINWNDYPAYFRRGTYISRSNIFRTFTFEELDKLPEKHEARRNPELKICRSTITQEDFPPITQILNKKEVIFDGATPVLSSSVPLI